MLNLVKIRVQNPLLDVHQLGASPENKPHDLAIAGPQPGQLTQRPLPVELVKEPGGQVHGPVVGPVHQAVVQHVVLHPVGPHHANLHHLDLLGEQLPQRQRGLDAVGAPERVVGTLVLLEPALEEPRVLAGYYAAVCHRHFYNLSPFSGFFFKYFLKNVYS